MGKEKRKSTCIVCEKEITSLDIYIDLGKIPQFRMGAKAPKTIYPMSGRSIIHTSCFLESFIYFKRYLEGKKEGK